MLGARLPGSWLALAPLSICTVIIDTCSIRVSPNQDLGGFWTGLAEGW